MPSTTRSKTKKSKKASVGSKKPYIRMAFEAIMHTKHAGKGASRAKIANYIKANYDNIASGAQFNTCLRKALNDGIARGVLEHGATEQRFKITNLGRKENKESNVSKKFDAETEEKKAKKEAKRKKAADKKKKAAEKKKKAEAAKKKKAAAAKKKKASSKKKNTRSSSSKKSTSSSKKGKKSTKKSTSKATGTRKSLRRSTRRHNK